jgi:AcrR family transcriptional regulator
MDNQRVHITKKMLKDSLIKLLEKESIHKISIREICDTSEINRTTFYKYYGSQYDLLKDMEDDVLKQIDIYLGADVNFDDTLNSITKTLTFINENLDLFGVLLNNNVDPEFPKKLIKIPSIQLLMKRRLKPVYNKEELDYIVSFITEGGFSIIKDWINKENRESPKEIATLLNNIIVRLLSS